MARAMHAHGLAWPHVAHAHFDTTSLKHSRSCFNDFFFKGQMSSVKCPQAAWQTLTNSGSRCNSLNLSISYWTACVRLWGQNVSESFRQTRRGRSKLFFQSPLLSFQLTRIICCWNPATKTMTRIISVRHLTRQNQRSESQITWRCGPARIFFVRSLCFDSCRLHRPSLLKSDLPRQA